MSNWEYFPVADTRPGDVRVFRESERDELELIVAVQIATMLSDYASCGPVDVDNSACVNTDEPKTYQFLALDPFVMENDGELLIHQIPFLHDEHDQGQFDAREGLHCIEAVDEDDIPQLQIACWDPDIDAVQRLMKSPRGDRVELEIVQELHEALIVCSFVLAQTAKVNLVPHETTAYPIAVVEPEFELFIQDFLK